MRDKGRKGKETRKIQTKEKIEKVKRGGEAKKKNGVGERGAGEFCKQKRERLLFVLLAVLLTGLLS